MIVKPCFVLIGDQGWVNLAMVRRVSLGESPYVVLDDGSRFGLDAREADDLRELMRTFSAVRFSPVNHQG